jgi:hypothetical protein
MNRQTVGHETSLWVHSLTMQHYSMSSGFPRAEAVSHSAAKHEDCTELATIIHFYTSLPLNKGYK